MHRVLAETAAQLVGVVAAVAAVLDQGVLAQGEQVHGFEAAHLHVAGGVADAVAEGYIERADLDASCIIAAVWVNPGADDEDAVYRNNREATRNALMNGAKNLPSIDEMLDNRKLPHNPFYTAKD